MRLLLLTCLGLACAGLLAAQAPDPFDAAPSRHARVDGVRVHYKSIGSGPRAVVLVHGWTCDLQFWKRQVAALSARTRVVALDSAKQAHYLPAILGIQAWFGSVDECVDAACTGSWGGRAP